MVRKAAQLFGWVLLAIGVLGFIPGITSDDHLLGLFHVNPLHNAIHLISGLVALWAGYSKSEANARTYFQVFGVIYGLVALLGVFYGDKDILGVLANNWWDVLLHLLITAGALYYGFLYKNRAVASEPAA